MTGAESQSYPEQPLWTAGRAGSRAVRWADAVVDLEADSVSDVGLGLRFRSAVPGPEQLLVWRFLESQIFQVPRGRTLSVFLQPAMDTGFPDLVAVVWRAPRTLVWVNERSSLRREDVRLLHLLSSNGWFEVTALERLFPRRLGRSLDRLEAAGLLLRGRQKVRARAMRDIFVVEQIVAIEAKVATTSRLMMQARNNIWFSSESYALLPVRRAASATVDRAAELGVGILGHAGERTRMFSRSAAQSVPSSYGSWLFNEWVGRLGYTGSLPENGEGEARWR